MFVLDLAHDWIVANFALYVLKSNSHLHSNIILCLNPLFLTQLRQDYFISWNNVNYHGDFFKPVV